MGAHHGGDHQRLPRFEPAIVARVASREGQPFVRDRHSAVADSASGLSAWIAELTRACKIGDEVARPRLRPVARHPLGAQPGSAWKAPAELGHVLDARRTDSVRSASASLNSPFRAITSPHAGKSVGVFESHLRG